MFNLSTAPGDLHQFTRGADRRGPRDRFGLWWPVPRLVGTIGLRPGKFAPSFGLLDTQIWIALRWPYVNVLLAVRYWTMYGFGKRNKRSLVQLSWGDEIAHSTRTGWSPNLGLFPFDCRVLIVNRKLFANRPIWCREWFGWTQLCGWDLLRPSQTWRRFKESGGVKLGQTLIHAVAKSLLSP